MTEPKTGLASFELKDALRLRWTLNDIKSQRTELVPVSLDDLRVPDRHGSRGNARRHHVVTPADDDEIS
jgi:hypothetical protein